MIHKRNLISAILQDCCEKQRDAAKIRSQDRREWFDAGMPADSEPDSDAYYDNIVKIENDALEAIMELVE
jgi:hypothetical protein